MPEGNGDHAWHEQMRPRMEALEKAHKEMEDALIVLTHVETRMSHLVNKRAEYMASHAERLIAWERRLDRIEMGLAEATDNINLLIDGEMKREGGPKSAR